MAKCLLYLAEARRCAGIEDHPLCRCNGVTAKCDFYPAPWKKKPIATPPNAELIAICQDAREACFARRCGNCKHEAKGFPQCQDHFYATKLVEHADQIIKLLKGTDDK